MNSLPRALISLAIFSAIVSAAAAAEPASPLLASSTATREIQTLGRRAAAGDGVVINVKDPAYGALGDGVTDDAPAINRALAVARKTGEYGAGAQGTVVFIPPGVYRLDAPLDLNGRQFNLIGAGSYQTVLRGNTGDRSAVVELVGSGFCKIAGVLIDDLVDALPAAERRPSSVGVLLARVDAPQNITNYSGARFAAQSYSNNLEDVTIRLGTRPAANGGHGTVAYYNVCSEVSGWHNCYFLADIGAFISTGNQFGIDLKTVREIEWRAGAPERMRMWAGESSMTVVRASGANGMFGITGPALYIGGGSDIVIDSCMGHLCHLYLPDAPERWPKYAIEIAGVSHNLAYRGSIEGYPGAVRISGAPVSALDLRCYLDIQPMYDGAGKELDSVPVVMLHHRQTESPAGSGKFVLTGSVLANSQLAPAPAPTSTSTIGRLIDSSAEASHVVEGNHMTLGNLKVRLRNAWATTALKGNLATSTQPLGKGQFQVPAGITRGGNLLMASDGVETDSFLATGAVAALPKPAGEHRGRMLRVEGDATHADGLFICEKDAAGGYVWRKL
jgi:hypothetical protein